METKSETEMETSFRYVREQLEIKGKEVERLHQLLDQSQQLLLNEQKKNQLLLESKAKPADWEKEKSRLESSVSQYRNSYNTVSQKASDYYEWALRAEKFFGLLRQLVVCSWYYYLSWGGSSFRDKQADLSSAFLSDNSGAVRLVILKKMTLDDLGKSANMTKMSLRFEGVFGISPPFLCGELAVCKTFSENAHLRSKV